MSMDSKQLAVPQSDCEVVLLSDCSVIDPQISVTLKTNAVSNTVESKVYFIYSTYYKIQI